MALSNRKVSSPGFEIWRSLALFIADMKNTETVLPFKASIEKKAIGTITTLEAKHGLSAKENITSKEASLITSYVYDENGNYKLVYTRVNPDGTIESFQEPDGILPILFISPAGENYVSLQPYDPDKDLEMSIPVFNRENTELPKRYKTIYGRVTRSTCLQRLKPFGYIGRLMKRETKQVRG